MSGRFYNHFQKPRELHNGRQKPAIIDQSQPNQYKIRLFWLIIAIIFGQTNSFYYLCG
jgi:hypothetical protein